MTHSDGSVKTGAAGARGLPVLDEIDDIATAWLERAAQRAEQQAARYRPADVAAAADDRRRPPPAELPPAPWEDIEPTFDWQSGIERDSSEGLPSSATDQLQQSGGIGGSFAASPTSPLLGLRREDISTVTRYLLAVKRVDAAFAVLEQRLDTAATEAAAGWSAAAAARAGRLLDKLEAVRRRRLALRECSFGRKRMTRFLCGSCGGYKFGPPAGCNARTCPQCVKKLRLEQMGRVGRILEAVEARRRHGGRSAPRWRFFTLTSPSWRAFRPMRQFLCAAWGRVLRSDAWSQVGAGLVAWETTHTASGWHVHVHGVADAYLPRMDFSRSWQCAQLAELVRAMVDGRWLDGMPAAVAELADVIRARQDRAGLVAAAQVVTRAARRWRCELRNILWPAADPPPVGGVEGARPTGDARAWLAVSGQVLASPWLATLRAILPALSTPAGVNVKHCDGDRSRVLSELAKYCGKDLGGAQVEDCGEWGVAGTPERLAEFIDGAWRWRTLRTYGDAFDRQDPGGSCECDDCGASPMQFDSTVWVTEEEAESMRRSAADNRRQRQRFRGSG